MPTAPCSAYTLQLPLCPIEGGHLNILTDPQTENAKRLAVAKRIPHCTEQAKPPNRRGSVCERPHHNTQKTGHHRAIPPPTIRLRR